jgi:ATP-dependent DNA helicase RecG
MSLSNELTGIKGIGPQFREKLSKMGLNTALDILFHLPRNYQDRTRLYPIKDLRLGYEVLVEGQILSAQIILAKRRMLVCHIADESGGMLSLRFFHFNQTQYHQMQKGLNIRCFGEIRPGKQSFEMVHPEYRIMEPGNPPELETHLTPVYSIPEGLGQNRWRHLVDIIITRMAHQELPEYLPPTLRQSHNFPTLFEALKFVHHPPPTVSLQQLLAGEHRMQQRLIFEELLAHRLSLRQMRKLQQKIVACL